MSFVPNDYLYQVARGSVTGAQPFSGFGRYTAAGAASGVLWPDGTYAFPPASGVQMSIVSTSANDDSGASGINSVEIHYLDANLASQVEIVTLDGITPVITVATDIRFIQCMHGATFGATKAAEGDITASNGGQTYAEISTGRLRCESSVRMVPAGKRLLVTTLYAGSVSGAAAAASVISVSSPNFEGNSFLTSNVFIPLASGAFQDSSGGITIPCPIAFTAGQAVGMTFSTDKAATLVGSWFGWLENA